MDKWKKSPVLVAFDSVQTGIYSIPFPALTVCNMNKACTLVIKISLGLSNYQKNLDDSLHQVRKSRVENIDHELSLNNQSEKYLVEKEFVGEICAKHENVGYSSHDSNGTEGHAETEDQGHHRRRKRGSSAHSSSSSDEEEDFGAHIGANGDLELTGKALHEYLADLGTPCEEMLLRCHFEGR